MPPTTTYDPGEIVLVQIVFTDLSGTKLRPALILSPKSYSSRYSDSVVLPLTSQPQPDARLALKDWQAAGLLMATWVKPLLATVSNSAIVRPLGRISAADTPAVQVAIAGLIDAQWIP